MRVETTNIRMDYDHSAIKLDSRKELAALVKAYGNQVSEDPGSQAPNGTNASDPTSGARGSTNCDAPGYAKDPLEELKKDPDYQDKKKLLDAAQKLENGQGLYFIDEEFGGGFEHGLGDGKINMANIEDAAKDPSSRGYQAARLLLDNPRLFSLIDADGDDLLTEGELRAFIAATKGEIQAMEKQAQESAASTNGTNGPPPSDSSNTARPPGGSSTNPPKESGTSETDLEKKFKEMTPIPAPSNDKTLDGAAANMNNLLGWTESEISRLSELYGQAEGNTKLQKEIETRMNELTRRAQSIASMMNQIMTMLSNISKMQSDIAMNSIRNMK